MIPPTLALPPYRYELCVGACPHRKMYVGDEATVWTCPVERRIWTDPMRPGWGFRITFSTDGLAEHGTTFEWRTAGQA